MYVCLEFSRRRPQRFLGLPLQLLQEGHRGYAAGGSQEALQRECSSILSHQAGLSARRRCHRWTIDRRMLCVGYGPTPDGCLICSVVQIPSKFSTVRHLASTADSKEHSRGFFLSNSREVFASRSNSRESGYQYRNRCFIRMAAIKSRATWSIQLRCPACGKPYEATL